MELVNVYNLEDPRVAQPMLREEFYNEQIEHYKKNNKPSKAVEVVHILLFNKHKQIVLQKRSRTKNHNPGLIDKAVGGHITFGNSPFYTLIVETVQELRVPSIVLYNKEDFSKTYSLLNSYLDNIAIVQYFDTHLFESERVINKELVKIANKSHLFLGVYGGATQPIDQEASGVLYYSLSELRAEMAERPDNFTGDIKYLLLKYATDIDQFLAQI